MASKGGRSGAKSGGGDASSKGKQGFASMDPDKQVGKSLLHTPHLGMFEDSSENAGGMLTKSRVQREIASMGGKASSGSFEPGSEKAREAGRKGGSASSTE